MFDGIKDAFSGDDADMAIDVDRETPFDRWMGINTKATVERKKTKAAFVDSMAEDNYEKVRKARHPYKKRENSVAQFQQRRLSCGLLLLLLLLLLTD